MKLSLRFTLVALVVMLVCPVWGREKRNFDFDWKFTLSDSKADFSPADITADDWADVQLPHDWNIYQQFVEAEGGAVGYLPAGTGWYRKIFNLAESDLKDKKVTVLFDGIFMQSTISRPACRALVCVQSSRTPGKIKVTVTAEGLPTAAVVEIPTR